MRRVIVAAADVVMALVAGVALVYTVYFGFWLMFELVAEFPSEPCECEVLEERLETVDWTGSGTGLRFENLKIQAFGPAKPYDDYLLAGWTVPEEMTGPDRAETIMRRLDGSQVGSRIPSIDTAWGGNFAYRVDQTVLLVDERSGRVTLRATNDLDATVAALDRIAEAIGEAQRSAEPDPTLHERITAALGPSRGTAISVSLVLVGLIWLRLRTKGVISLTTTRSQGVSG